MTENQIREGIPKIIMNAESLYSDAELLRSNGRNERAYTLYQLSIEEIGKALMLTGALMFDDLEDKRIQQKIKGSFKDHKRKSNISIGLDSFLWDFIKPNNPEKYEKLLLESFDEHANVDTTNELKNNSLYVSFNGNKFTSPSETITLKKLEEIKTKAGYRVYFGKKIFSAIVENIDKIKKRIKEIGYDSNKTSQEQQQEFKRGMNKF